MVPASRGRAQSLLAARFAAQCARGVLRSDPAPARALERLDELRRAIYSHTAAVAQYETALTSWQRQVAELREQQRLSEARERERLASLPFYQRWLLQLREAQAAPRQSPEQQQPGSCSGGCN